LPHFLFFQTIESNQRRKDIYQALTTNMAALFSFFLGLIEKHLEQFRSFSEVGNVAEATANGRVVQVIII
jgi:exportin-5